MHGEQEDLLGFSLGSLSCWGTIKILLGDALLSPFSRPLPLKVLSCLALAGPGCGQQVGWGHGRDDAECLGSLSCGCDKIPRQTQLKRERVYLAHNFRFHHCVGNSRQSRCEAASHMTSIVKSQEHCAPVLSSLYPLLHCLEFSAR